jgi:hypothetical protein
MKVTDAGLENLKGLTQLRWLLLGDMAISDAGLEHLKGLTQLQLLLKRTTVTIEAVRGLQQTMPKCQIVP